MLDGICEKCNELLHYDFNLLKNLSNKEEIGLNVYVNVTNRYTMLK